MSRGLAAVLLEAVFFALAFGARSWIQWRRTGSTGFIRPHRGDPPAERAGAVLFIVALLLLMAGPITDLAGMSRIAVLDSRVAAVVGLVLAVLGIVLTLAAQLAMGDSWRIGVDNAERTALVTGGVFRLVRNPIFSAMAVAAVGLALLVPTVVSVAAVVVLVVALEIQVRLVEEPYLRSVHGAAYDRYVATAGRFVPRPGAKAS